MDNLSQFQYYFLHWLRDEKHTAIERETIIGSRSTKFEEDRKLFEEIGQLTIQRAVDPFVLLFIEIINKQLDETKESVEYIEDLLEHLKSKDFMTDYIDGLEYLFSLIKIHLNFAQNLKNNFKEFDYTKSYEQLESKSKSILFVAQWMLNERIQSRKEEVVHLLKKMIELDPENWNWHYLLCMRIRFLRRQRIIDENPSIPSAEEIDAAYNSAKYSKFSLKYSMMSDAAISQCLAEIVRFKHIKKDNSRIAVWDFHLTMEEAVEYLKEKAGDAVIYIDISFPEFIRYGEIFGIILPERYRDYPFALMCLKAAVLDTPNNSKANHKMGAIILRWKGDVEKAIPYLLRAIQIHAQNFGAWMELFPLLLIKFESHEKSFQEGFESIYKESWSERDRGHFLYYEGCVEFLKQNPRNAVEKWIEAVALKVNIFHEIGIMLNRRYWPKSHPITQESVWKVISEFVPGNEDKKETLQELKSSRVLKDRAKGNTFESRACDSSNTTTFSKMRHSHTSSAADNDTMWRRPTSNSASTDRPQADEFGGSNDGNRSGTNNGGRNTYIPPRRRTSSVNDVQSSDNWRNDNKK